MTNSGPTGMPRYKALYLLAEGCFEIIYGRPEREDIAARVDVIESPLTGEAYAASSRSWPEIDLIFSGWGMVPMDEIFLQRFPNLKAVFYGAGSVKAFTTEPFWERKILLTSAYATNAIPVAEFTLAQILYSLKKGWQQALWIRQHRRYPDPMPVPGAYQSTVGLLSLGMTGRLVAEHLRRFDLNVIAYDPFVSAEAATRLHVRMASLDEVFAQADVVSCHAPLLPETERMIRGRHFEMMKPGATFLNTARGRVVDEGEMIEILQKRPDLWALLDVTFPEPPVENSPLYNLENVIMTPHLAGSMGSECRRMGRTMVEELDRFLAGEPLLFGIDRQKAATLA
jgi:phosphoglycerate dehydrogenase-like enzyme